MSMREHPYVEYGVLLNPADYRQIAAVILGREPENFDEMADILDNVIDVVRVENFTGEVFKVHPIYGTLDEMNSVSYDSGVVYYCPFNKVGTLFTGAYNSADEIVEEAKKKIGQYLPDDFDYKYNIVKIVGTVLY